MSTMIISSNVEIDGSILNLVVEQLTSDPVPLEAGRVWYNTTDKEFNFSGLDAEGTAVKNTFSTKAELLQAIADLKAELADPTKGGKMVAFPGATGANGKLSILANNSTDAITELVTKLDTYILDQENASSSLASDLADTTVDSDGALMIGFDGYSSADNIIVLPAQDMSKTVDSMALQVETKVKEILADMVSQSRVGDQALSGKLTLQDVVILGDLTQQGVNTILEGTTVKMGDNIITLNDQLTAEDTFAGTAGWEVNRGSKGVLQVSLWDETSKSFVGARVTTDGEGVETVTLERVLLGDEFDAYKTIVDDKLAELETKVGDNIGDLTTLTTDAKDTLVNAINEVDGNYDSLVADLASTEELKGASLIGVQAISSTNGFVSLIAGDLQVALAGIADKVDENDTNLDALIAKLGGVGATEGAEGIGYAGRGAVEDLFYVPSGTVDGAIDAVVDAIKTDRQTVADLNTDMDTLVSNINAKKYQVVSPAAQIHTITHGLGTMNVVTNALVKDGTDWVNHPVPVKVVDTNTISVTLNSPFEINFMIESFEAVAIA